MKKKLVKLVRSYRAAGIRPNLFVLPQTSLRGENEALILFDTPLYVVIYICRCVTTIGYFLWRREHAPALFLLHVVLFYFMWLRYLNLTENGYISFYVVTF